MLLIFLGAPGSGKGTISNLMVDEHGYKHISTGDIFRKVVSEGKELGLKIKEIIDNGQLVDDTLTWEVAKVALSELNLEEDNIILDGYPRNIHQAKLMNDWIKENHFSSPTPIYFEVSKELILSRLTGREMCKVCGRAYHKLNMPSKVEGKCDLDGGDLYQREDDKLENINVRLKIYDETTKPLIKYYEDINSLLKVNGEDDKEIAVKNVLELIRRDNK